MLLTLFVHSPVTQAGEDAIIIPAVPQNFLNSAALVKWPGDPR